MSTRRWDAGTESLWTPVRPDSQQPIRRQETRCGLEDPPVPSGRFRRRAQTSQAGVKKLWPCLHTAVLEMAKAPQPRSFMIVHTRPSSPTAHAWPLPSVLALPFLSPLTTALSRFSPFAAHLVSSVPRSPVLAIHHRFEVLQLTDTVFLFLNPKRLSTPRPSTGPCPPRPPLRAPPASQRSAPPAWSVALAHRARAVRLHTSPPLGSASANQRLALARRPLTCERRLSSPTSARKTKASSRRQ